MAKLFREAASGREAQEHFKETILNKVSLNRIERFFKPNEFAELKSLFPEGEARVWGSVPGKSNLKNWENMEKGDWVIFYQNGFYTFIGQISYKIRSPKLSRSLWGTDRKTGETWELVYFLTEGFLQNIDTREINSLLGYKEAPVFGLSKVRDDIVANLTSKYGNLKSALYSKLSIENLISSPEEAEYYLLKVGKSLSYKTYTPDFGRSAFGEKLSTLTDLSKTDLEEIVPSRVKEAAVTIDVSWIKKIISGAFEVVHKSGMKEAFGRLLSVKAYQTEAGIYIVGPQGKEEEFNFVGRKFYADKREEIKFRTYTDLLSFVNAVENFKVEEKEFFS